MATRPNFDENAHGYRGGRVDDDPISDDKPKRLRYPCFAGGCPMPGTILPSGGKDGGPGSCAWHYGTKPSDIPRVTQVLKDWACLTYEVNEARRALTGDIAADPKALADAFTAAWERLEPLVGDWAEQLRPGPIRSRNRATGIVSDSHMPEGYADWAKRLTEFLGARVVEVLSTHRERKAA
jgi:hypothetical protein